MRLLLIKTSSIGDVIHTFPALTDAARAVPGLTVDWVVEEGLAEIVTWHPAVRTAIPIAWDGIAVVVDFTNPVKEVTTQQVAAIFSRKSCCSSGGQSKINTYPVREF
mgnify:CR=1 FL=1